jgi:3-deoxy-D-manno-octulosonic-acid transferase
LNSLKTVSQKQSYSQKSRESLADFDVFIIDTIGILTKIYSYADIAFVGGGFGNPGVHNLLEPATLSSIIVGPILTLQKQSH